MNLSAKLPTFYNDIISHWQELNKVVPTTKKHVLDQIVWNNRFITTNKASVYFWNWHHAGIHKLSSLLDAYNNRFLAFNEFSQKLSWKVIFLQYHGLLSAISSQQQASTVNLPEIDMLMCKTIYKLLIDCQNFPPPTAEKRLIECGFDIHERQKIYSLPFLVTKEIKLSIFQYKIIHNTLYTSCILFKMKKVQDPHCPFCTNVDQTVGHLFVSCPISSSFWSDFIRWYHSVSRKTLSLSKNEIIYGVLTNWSSCSTLNHLILIGKYFSIANH